MFIIILESCVYEIMDANAPSTIPGNKKKTRIYYYTKKKQMYFQMIIINDLQVIIFWPSVPKLYLYHL